MTDTPDKNPDDSPDGSKDKVAADKRSTERRQGTERRDNAQSGFVMAEFDKNKTIFDEGDEGDAAYLIVRGKVEIRKGVRTSQPQILATLSKGDVFGEMALFDNAARMAQAVALTKVETIRISRDEFHKRLDSVDPVMRTIVLYLVHRVRGMADQFMRKKSGVNWHEWRTDKKPDFYS